MSNLVGFPCRIIVASGRDFIDRSNGFKYVSEVTYNLLPTDIEIICGEAKGAENMIKLSKQYKLQTSVYCYAKRR